MLGRMPWSAVICGRRFERRQPRHPHLAAAGAALAPSSLPPPNQFGRQRHTAGCCVLLRPLDSLRRQTWTVPTLTSRDPDISRLDLRRPLAYRLHVESSHQQHTALLYLCWSHAFAFGTRALHADVLISHPLSGRSLSFRLDRRALSGVSADPPRRSAYEAAPPTPRPTDPPSTRPNSSCPRSSERRASLALLTSHGPRATASCFEHVVHPYRLTDSDTSSPASRRHEPQRLDRLHLVRGIACSPRRRGAGSSGRSTRRTATWRS